MKVVLFDLVVGGHHVEYASYIIRYLVEQGDEVTFVTWKPSVLLDALLTGKTSVTVEYVVSDSTAEFGGNVLRRFRQTVKGIRYCFDLALEQQADIVHHLYLERSELPLYLLMRLRKRPWKLFGTLFWPYFVHRPNEKLGLPKRIYHGINCWSLGQLFKQRKLNGLFVHTDRIQELLVRLYGDVAFREGIFVIPDPVELLEKTSQEEARDRLGLPHDKPVILFFGGLRSDKGPDVLLEALSLLDGDWYTVLAGEPGEIGEAEVKQSRERLREPERLITRLGHIPDRDVANYFAAADVVVLPYRRAFKGTSGILQHAAVAGKPVVAADVGEVGPTVREYGLGIVVDPESPMALAEGIRRFLAEREEMSKDVRSRALQYAEANNWRIMAKRVREAYTSAVKLKGEDK